MKTSKKALENKKKYYIKNKERILKQKKEYYLRTKKLKNRKCREYYIKNREKILEDKKVYRLINAEKRKKILKDYYYKNREELLKKKRQYNKDNRKILTEKQKEYNKKRRKEDKNYNLLCRFRSRLNYAISNYGNGKKAPSNKYGIDWNEVIDHLKPFPKNISKYHIDHIKPLCAFDLTNRNEVKKAFAPENHQWLLAKENLSKGGMI